MTVIGKFMKRLGWVRQSEGGSPEAPYGQPSEQSWSFVPEAQVDPASVFDPNLAARPKRTLPPPAPVQQTQAQRPAAQQPAQAAAQQPAQAAAPAPWQAQLAQQVAPPAPQSEEDAWLAAVAKAKSQEVDRVQTEEPEEDWEALMEAARQRAEASPSPVARVLAVARQRAKSAPPVASAVSPVFAVPTQPERPLDAASFQVERGAVAANDDRLPVKLSAVTDTSPEEEEWKQLRAEVEAKERAEAERKVRAIREIRRLRGSRNMRQVQAPARTRLATGTVQPPLRADGTPTPATAKRRNQALVMNPKPALPRPRTTKSPVSATASSLPRITQRLKNGS